MRKVFAINGSASKESANQKLLNYLAELTKNDFCWTIFSGLKELPPFDPELSVYDPPQVIVEFRQNVDEADYVLICSPEYVFSIPSGLKNAIEWCVSTTVFSDKPLGIITASAQGQKGHQELQLIMSTLMAKFNTETTLLIQGIKGKLTEHGELTDSKTAEDLHIFMEAMKSL